MAVVTSSSGLLTLFSNATAVAAAAVSSEYNREIYRYHVFQLIGTRVTDSVRLEFSLDGTHWTTLATMTGLSVLYRHGQDILPAIRAVRLDTPVDANDKLLLLAYSGVAEGTFE